jgi:uroporphyrinogen decarboxylase
MTAPEPMDRIARVRAALATEAVDRLPFTVWYHFGLQHLPPERLAEAHVEFADAYDLDWLKVMNDYGYPMPDGLEVATQASDLRRLTPVDVTRGPLGQQLALIAHLAPRLRGRMFFVDTIFDAWSSLRRSVVKDAMDRLMHEEPAALERALAVVNENLVAYAEATLQRGAAGIFLSVPAGADAVTPEQFDRFVRPFAHALLERIAAAGGATILHAHGSRLHFQRILDLPAQALSWADRAAGPTLAEARRMTDRPLIGGIDHARFNRMSRIEVRAQVRQAVEQTGPRGLLLAGGCSIPPNAFADLIQAARVAARGTS